MLMQRSLSNVVYFFVLLLVFLKSAPGHGDETTSIFSQPYAPTIINELRPLPPSILNMAFNVHGIQGKSVLPLDFFGQESSISYEKFMHWIDTFFLSGHFKDYLWKIRSVPDTPVTPSTSKDSPEASSSSDEAEHSDEAGHSDKVEHNDHTYSKPPVSEKASEKESFIDKTPARKKKKATKRHSKKTANRSDSDAFIEELRLDSLRFEASTFGITWEEVTTDYIPEDCPLVIWMIMHEVHDALRHQPGTDEDEKDFSEILKEFDPALELVLRAMLEAIEGEKIGNLSKIWLKYGLIKSHNHLNVEEWLLQEKPLSYFPFDFEEIPLFYAHRLAPWGKDYMKYNGIKPEVLYATKLNKKHFRSQVLWNLIFQFHTLKAHIKGTSLDEFKVFENVLLSILDDLFRETNNMKQSELALMVLWLDMEIDRYNVDFNWRAKLRQLRTARRSGFSEKYAQRTSLHSSTTKKRKSGDKDEGKDENKDKNEKEVKRKRTVEVVEVVELVEVDENLVSTKSGRQVIKPKRLKE